MWSERDYGNRVGVFRIMETLDRYGIRGTVALNSNLCAEHPQIIAEGEKRKWEWMGHNESNTRRLNEAEPGEEAGIIRRTLDTIGKATGRRPTGWLSSGLQQTWDTLDLLAAEGVEYQGDWCNDDQPYVMNLDGGRSIVAMPYTQQLNDKSAIERRLVSADGFGQMICDQFDVLYREGAKSGRVMAIALHPYLIGVPHRIGALDKALKYICKHKKVWKATGAEIARHYLAQLKDGIGYKEAQHRRGNRRSERANRGGDHDTACPALLRLLLIAMDCCSRLRPRAPPTPCTVGLVGGDQPDALADPYRAEEGLLRRGGPQARSDPHPVERQRDAAACRRLDRCHAVGRPGRSDLCHRQGRADLRSCDWKSSCRLTRSRPRRNTRNWRTSRARRSWSTPPRASPGSMSSACWPRTTSSRARSTTCMPARPGARFAALQDRRGRCHHPAAAVQLHRRGAGLQQSRHGRRLRQGSAVHRRRREQQLGDQKSRPC